jgi:maltooligosyltrehalose trehalohydrolase
VDARAGMGVMNERQLLVTLPEPSVPEHLISPEAASVRRLPIGAEPQLDGGVHFRVWAPRCREVVVEIEGLEPAALQPETDGYFSLWSVPARAGMRYRFRLDRGEKALPDPASRFQPEGPHGPSEIVDPGDFAWTDGAWRGRAREELIIYELHVGTFTPDGSWKAASRELPALAELGITCLEIMPVAEFPGRFGWGYDGVNLFAPTRLYGRPNDFRRFVDRAHALGIAVILDVVYNHFGPDGNYLKLFSAAYFTDRCDNEWGEAINFDGPDSGPPREFFVANAGYWIDEYHLDGLRLDATQAIFDRSEDHILAAVARQVRSAGRGRITFVVGENEPQHAKLARPAERGGYGLDALWNDDFHHSAMVALTGHHEAYYSDYRGRPGEFVAAAKHGFLYQGQRYQWQRNARGTPTFDLPAECFVVFLQNHDQIANSGTGERCHALTSPGRLRAMTAFFLLMPGIPMLFQGQEFGASSPFFYFADHEIELSHDVREGRRRSLAQFPSLATSEMRVGLADPGDIDTFRRSVLDLGERQRHASIYALHRDLLELRRTDPVLGQRPCRIDGAALTDEAWMLRFFSQSGADRLLIVNLGRDLLLGPAPEPLLAPIEGQAWRLLWSSEAPVYGGSGGPAQDAVGDWLISGQSAIVLTPGSSVTIPEAKNVFHLREANG